MLSKRTNMNMPSTVRGLLISLLLLITIPLRASYILLPMDFESQKDHLKAYGITYWVLESGQEGWWLLNYRGGSFAFPYSITFEKECKTRGVSFETISDATFNQIISEIAHPEKNMDAIKMDKETKISV